MDRGSRNPSSILPRITTLETSFTVSAIGDSSSSVGPLLHCVLDVGQLAGPKPAVLGGPAVVDHLNRHRVVIEPAVPALFLGDEEVTVLELAEVMHDRDSRGIEFSRHLAHRAARRALDEIENPATSRIAERVEDRRHVIHM